MCRDGASLHLPRVHAGMHPKPSHPLPQGSPPETASPQPHPYGTGRTPWGSPRPRTTKRTGAQDDLAHDSRCGRLGCPCMAACDRDGRSCARPRPQPGQAQQLAPVVQDASSTRRSGNLGRTAAPPILRYPHASYAAWTAPSPAVGLTSKVTRSSCRCDGQASWSCQATSLPRHGLRATISLSATVPPAVFVHVVLGERFGHGRPSFGVGSERYAEAEARGLAVIVGDDGRPVGPDAYAVSRSSKRSTLHRPPSQSLA